MKFGLLKISKTCNLGDCIQTIAAENILKELDKIPSVQIDRDCGLASSKDLTETKDNILIILNGWFKHKYGSVQWPPHNKIIPIFIGFHIRLRWCPELVSPLSIKYFKKWGPIGCRDPYTVDLLKKYHVPAYYTGCLSLLFPLRSKLDTQDTTIVVSTDRNLLKIIPACIKKKHIFMNHYIEKGIPYCEKMQKAHEFLEIYKNHAKLVITTFLHCALPCIAMGIPTVVFYPNRGGILHRSDIERFGALLQENIHIYKYSDQDINWSPVPIEWEDRKVALKRDLVEKLNRMISIGL